VSRRDIGLRVAVILGSLVVLWLGLVFGSDLSPEEATRQVFAMAIVYGLGFGFVASGLMIIASAVGIVAGLVEWIESRDEDDER
jgi:uncharacterized protein (DUF697 family)